MQGWIDYAGTHDPMFVARHRSVSSHGLLNENESLGYLANFDRNVVSRLSLTVGLFRRSGFLSSLVGLLGGPGWTYLAIPWCFSWLKKTQYQEGNLGRVHVNHVLSKVAFVFQTVAAFVRKWARKWIFKIVNQWDKRDNGIMCAGKEIKSAVKVIRMGTGVEGHTCMQAAFKKKNKHWDTNIVLL